jgi:hypothetical protein
MRNSFESNPRALGLIREALTAVNLKIRVSGQEPYRAGGGAGAQPRAAEVAARARSASPLGATGQARLDARGALAAAEQIRRSGALRDPVVAAAVSQMALDARGTLSAINQMRVSRDTNRGRQAAASIVALAKKKAQGGRD